MKGKVTGGGDTGGGFWLNSRQNQNCRKERGTRHISVLTQVSLSCNVRKKSTQKKNPNPPPKKTKQPIVATIRGEQKKPEDKGKTRKEKKVAVTMVYLRGRLWVGSTGESIATRRGSSATGTTVSGLDAPGKLYKNCVCEGNLP